MASTGRSGRGRAEHRACCLEGTPPPPSRSPTSLPQNVARARSRAGGFRVSGGLEQSAILILIDTRVVFVFSAPVAETG